ncbi:MAG: hypothetical protein ACTSQG_10070, partial [Promethearchaeota archaeon]
YINLRDYLDVTGDKLDAGQDIPQRKITPSNKYKTLKKKISQYRDENVLPPRPLYTAPEDLSEIPEESTEEFSGGVGIRPKQLISFLKEKENKIKLVDEKLKDLQPITTEGIEDSKLFKEKAEDFSKLVEELKNDNRKLFMNLESLLTENEELRKNQKHLTGKYEELKKKTKKYKHKSKERKKEIEKLKEELKLLKEATFGFENK